MKKLLMVVMMVGVVATAGVTAHADSVALNMVGHVLGGPDVAGAPGYVQGFWNNVDDGPPAVSGNMQEGPGTYNAGFVKDNTGAIVAGMTITWDGDVAHSAPSGGGTVGDNWMMNWMVGGSTSEGHQTGTATIDVTNIPYAYYDVVAYVPSNWPARGTAVSVTGHPDTYYNYPGGTYTGPYIQVTSTTPGDTSDIGNYAVFSGMTDPNITMTITANPGAGLGDAGYLAGFQIVEADPPPPPPIPEPAGLGLMGVALLAVRRRRS